MSNWYREIANLVEDTTNLVEVDATPSTLVFDVIKIYMDHVERWNGERFKTKFPEIDDDIMADSIAEYLGKNYSLDAWQSIYDQIKKHFKVFG